VSERKRATSGFHQQRILAPLRGCEDKEGHPGGVRFALTPG